MEINVKFKKNKIILAIVFGIIMLVISIWFIFEPIIFIRNIFMKEEYIILTGIISSVFFLTFILSLFRIVSRETALIICEEYLFDNSKYESYGKIYWSEISKIKRIEKRSLQIFFNRTFHERKDINILKKFMLWMQNWNYNKSIIISSALLDCNIDYLEESILLAYKNHKLKIMN